MTDMSIKKIHFTHLPEGQLCQKYLASGKIVSIGLWKQEEPRENKQPTEEDYETVGYVVDGCAELHIEGQVILLERGSCWVVPKWTHYQYKILEPFTAIYRYLIYGSKL
ncbi:cupin 2 domain-containing protein [Cylindrospermum sp. NIES-4074]|nr:cupin 2 domain-containing protein [Cylindrospermum sp. NIES-4074]